MAVLRSLLFVFLLFSFSCLAEGTDGGDDDDDSTVVESGTVRVDPPEVSVTTPSVGTMKEVKNVYLQFGDNAPIKKSPDSPIATPPGTFPVKCTSEGGNPAVSTSAVRLDGAEVTIRSDVEEGQMKGGEMVFTSSVTADVTVPDTPSATHQLECVVSGANGKKMSVKLDLKVIVPHVSPVQCQKVKAKEGDKAVSLVCVVDDSKLNVTEYAFEIGMTGEKIEPNGKDADSSAAKNETEAKTGGEVTVTKLEAGKTQVKLTLEEAKDWHFDTDFYLLLTTKEGDVKKETLRLENADADDSAQALSFGLGFSGILLLSLLVNADWL